MNEGTMSNLYKRAPFPPTQMPYRVHTHGRIVDTPRHATLGTYHGDCMLTIFLEGKGYYRCGNVSQPIEAGMVGVVLPGPGVGVLLADEREPYDHLFCRFCGDLALAAARRVVHSRGGASFAPSPLWMEVAKPLTRMLATYKGEDAAFADRMRPCDGLLAEALAILDCPAGPGPGLTALSVEAFISERVSVKADLRTMADHFGVTREYLCRRVKTLTGRSPLDLWREEKIRWAKALLHQAGLSVAETARRVGFDDPYYFSKVFKQSTGQSPSRYLRASAPSAPIEQ